MFHYFFDEYKKTIYKGTTFKEGIQIIRSLPKEGKRRFLFFIVCYIVMVITFCLEKPLGYLICILALLVDTRAIQSWYNQYTAEMRATHIEQYKKKMSEPLIGLLNKETYSFYSAKKVEWLILCCDAELEQEKNPFRNMPDSFSKWVFPIFTLFLGTKIDSLDSNSVLVILFIVFFAWLIAFIFKIVGRGVMDYLTFPDKKALLALKSELQFIKAELEAPKTNGTDSKSSQDDSERAPEMVAQAGT